MKRDDIKAALREAEMISEQVTDPDLRKIAFATVLERMLADPTMRASPSKVDGHPVSKTPSRAAVSRPANGPTAWVESLRAEGFFAQPKSLANVVERIQALGHNIESKNVTEPLEKMVQAKILHRERSAEGGSKRRVWIYTSR
jgi:hypothetical protein